MPLLRARMQRPFVHALAFAMLMAPLVAAAQAPAASTRLIEQDMSPAEFRAAGLDRLSPEQLARLNAWLGRTLDAEAARAADTARREVRQDGRGMFDMRRDAPVNARLQGEFTGFASGRRYTLDNGQVWEQVDGATLAGARLQGPAVKVTPSLVGNTWYLSVDGYNTRAKVRRVQ